MILLNGPAMQMLPDVARPAHGRSGPAVLDLPRSPRRHGRHWNVFSP